MHTCGNVTEIFPDLIECGIDIIHPIQVGTMDASYIVKTFKGQIAFHVGMDVQTLIPSGTVEEVISGIRERAELFYDQSGGVVYGAGNVLMANTPAENIEAYIKTLFEFCMKKHR
jgi:uroporphyrinogen decarboxylase